MVGSNVVNCVHPIPVIVSVYCTTVSFLTVIEINFIKSLERLRVYSC